MIVTEELENVKIRNVKQLMSLKNGASHCLIKTAFMNQK
ncbi:hypothetical protein P790_0328 [Enterococcus faecalis NJ44]|nr:hypothetical protein P790_0328 [Enterococcus faecalis NJ44]